MNVRFANNCKMGIKCVLMKLKFDVLFSVVDSCSMFTDSKRSFSEWARCFWSCSKGLFWILAWLRSHTNDFLRITVKTWARFFVKCFKLHADILWNSFEFTSNAGVYCGCHLDCVFTEFYSILWTFTFFFFHFSRFFSLMNKLFLMLYYSHSELQFPMAMFNHFLNPFYLFTPNTRSQSSLPNSASVDLIRLCCSTLLLIS